MRSYWAVNGKEKVGGGPAGLYRSAKVGMKSQDPERSSKKGEGG